MQNINLALTTDSILFDSTSSLQVKPLSENNKIAIQGEDTSSLLNGTTINEN